MNKKFCDTKKHTFLTIPWYGWVAAAIILVVHLGLYKIAAAINMNCRIWQGLNPKIDALDNAIPFCPWFFIQIYYLSYIFWFVATLFISKQDKANFINYMIELVTASILVFLLFIFVPTYQDRTQEHLKEQVDKLKDPFTKALCNFMYFTMDGGNTAVNMAPSYHCLYSIFALTGIVMQKKGKLYNKIWISIFGMLICLSTMFVKQHYFMDFLTATIVAMMFFLPTMLWLKPGEKILKAKPNFLEIKSKKNTSVKH